MSGFEAEASFNSPIDGKSLVAGVDALVAVDTDLASIIERHGYPPLWKREPGFATLVHIILEQQVSLLSALATFRRFSALVDPLTPRSVLALDPAELRGIGFSRQKIDYTRGLAAAITEGRIDLDALEAIPDDEARAELMKLKGIGRWSADIYLLMALGRPDIWPEGDLPLLFLSAPNISQKPKGTSMEMVTNAINWFEITVEDFERARKFYSAIFDYEMPSQQMGPAQMGFFLSDQGKGVGGAIIHREGARAGAGGTLVYLNGGNDLSTVLGRVEEAGGKVIEPKTEVAPDMGYFAVFGDTEGNQVALHSMA